MRALDEIKKKREKFLLEKPIITEELERDLERDLDRAHDALRRAKDENEYTATLRTIERLSSEINRRKGKAEGEF